MSCSVARDPLPPVPPADLLGSIVERRLIRGLRRSAPVSLSSFDDNAFIS